MDENKILSEEINNTDAETAENAEKPRYTGGDTGAQFAKSIGIAGCIFFLVLFIAFLVFCFTSGLREPFMSAPQFSHILSAVSGGIVNG